MHPHPALRATFSQREKDNSSRQPCTQMFQNLQKIVLDSGQKGHYNAFQKWSDQFERGRRWRKPDELRFMKMS